MGVNVLRGEPRAKVFQTNLTEHDWSKCGLNIHTLDFQASGKNMWWIPNDLTLCHGVIFVLDSTANENAMKAAVEDFHRTLNPITASGDETISKAWEEVMSALEAGGGVSK